MNFYKKVFLKLSQNPQKATCVGVSFFKKVSGLRSLILLKKKSPILVFCCELCEIFKKTYFEKKGIKWAKTEPQN